MSPGQKTGKHGDTVPEILAMRSDGVLKSALDLIGKEQHTRISFVIQRFGVKTVSVRGFVPLKIDLEFSVSADPDVVPFIALLYPPCGEIQVEIRILQPEIKYAEYKTAS